MDTLLNVWAKVTRGRGGLNSVVLDVFRDEKILELHNPETSIIPFLIGFS